MTYIIVTVYLIVEPHDQKAEQTEFVNQFELQYSISCY